MTCDTWEIPEGPTCRYCGQPLDQTAPDWRGATSAIPHEHTNPTGSVCGPLLNERAARRAFTASVHQLDAMQRDEPVWVDWMTRIAISNQHAQRQQEKRHDRPR